MKTKPIFRLKALDVSWVEAAFSLFLHLFFSLSPVLQVITFTTVLCILSWGIILQNSRFYCALLGLYYSAQL